MNRPHDNLDSTDELEEHVKEYHQDDVLKKMRAQSERFKEDWYDFLCYCAAKDKLEACGNRIKFEYAIAVEAIAESHDDDHSHDDADTRDR
jgi:hypothetical protein